MQRTTLTEAQQLDIISSFIPHLTSHIEDRGLELTASGFSITPEWGGWTIKAYCCRSAGEDMVLIFTADEAAAFLADIGIELDMNHDLLDAYATWDGYGIQCTCGTEWIWIRGVSDFSLDDMAQMARQHCAEMNRVDA